MHQPLEKVKYCGGKLMTDLQMIYFCYCMPKPLALPPFVSLLFDIFAFDV